MQIAATGLKPPSTQQFPNNTGNPQKHDIPSSPPDGTNIVSPSNDSKPSAFTPKQKKLVPLAPKDVKETGIVGTNGPQVHIQKADSTSPPGNTPRALDGMLMPTTTEEAGTQVSSSSGSAKPPSLDGKSVTSGTTFALDEKESLRPDDSASVKATEDEDAFQPGSGLPGSRTGSDDGVRAFRDQLREISYLESPRPAPSQQTFSHGVNQPQGMLYIPPQGSGVGTVPGSARMHPVVNQGPEVSPDPKLLEALESPKDRIMVLKLEQDIVDFIKDARELSMKLPQTNAFYRMLAHKLAEYYGLSHVVDESTMAVQISKTPKCHLAPPLTGIATPSTAASTPPPMGPQMKILRRGLDNASPAIVNGSNAPSKATSENGESYNDDERRHRLPASREEREARYEAARKRIMGSAKPAESPEETSEREESRPSSAAAKKNNRRKQRTDSDDDFEARSAYSAYYPVPYSSNASTPPSYGFANIVDSQGGRMVTTPYGNQDTIAIYQQYGVPRNNSWSNQGCPTHDGTASWMQTSQAGYDLSGDFQRAMSFQPSPMPSHTPSMQPGYSPTYGQQFNIPQQPWPQHNPYIPGYSPSHGPNFQPAFSNHPPSASNHIHDGHQYPFGQLPSQTFGRTPSKLEHPLPGSYKSKHFNPQSQTFVPGQVNGSNSMPFAPQAAPLNTTSYNASFAVPGPLLGQSSTPSQQTSYGSPHQAISVAGPQRVANQPMTHPLPQPVFPRQPSPNVPLPPKPEATPPKPVDKTVSEPSPFSGGSASLNQNSISKWGTPASLPAKPPPSVEPFDPSKFAQAQRQPSASASRPPSNMPAFGSMPPMSGGHVPSAQGVQSTRRI